MAKARQDPVVADEASANADETKARRRARLGPELFLRITDPRHLGPAIPGPNIHVRGTRSELDCTIEAWVIQANGVRRFGAPVVFAANSADWEVTINGVPASGA